MADPASFTDRENWTGWDYELALIFRPVPGRDLDELVREGKDGDDWIYLSLTQGSLARIDARVDDLQTEIWPGQEVRADESRVWREPIDRWFIAVAHRVYERAPFEWGQISYDITGIEYGIPDDEDHEWMTFLVPSPSGLQVIPPKNWT